MATIILGALGRFIGGPVGGAIGSILGQAVDSSLLGSKTLQGPRLKELGVQTSGYGNAIPAVFGAVRIAGSVIWATDLIEHKSKSGGGKGRPKTVQYSYSASFAVALSSRAVLRIGRIWADGNLLRGAAGDFKTRTTFRFYSGHDDQPADPLIAAAKGSAGCPAFRGVSYAVFEDMELADFGNRIPSLTFEIFERDIAVPLTEIAAALSGGNIAGNSAETVRGYAAEGDDVRTALAPLIETLPVILRPQRSALALHDWWSSGLSASDIDVAAAAGRTEFSLPSRRRGAPGKQVQTVMLRHYDPARDFQTGVQRSEQPRAGRIARQIDLPASLDANAARRIADLQMQQSRVTRDSWSGHAVTAENALVPGDWIADPGGDGKWQIAEIEYLMGASRISARRSLSAYPDRAYAADAGSSVPAPDFSAGPTRLAVMDLPALDGVDPTQPLVAIAASGGSPGWRAAALSLQSPTGLIDIGITAPAAVIGTVVGSLAPHPAYLIDTMAMLDIQLAHGGMIIPAGPGDPLASDAILCWIGGELVRAGRAQYLGNNRYRLSMLQRGCFGSEANITSHIAGETFVLMEASSIRGIDGAYTALGASLTVEALGIADPAPVLQTVAVTGRALQPFAPVHAAISRTASGDITLMWVRRTRTDPGWQDYVDVPMIEGILQFTVSVMRGGLMLASENVMATVVTFTSARLAEWGVVGGDQLTLQIAQIGRYGRSAVLSLQYTVPA
jgi:hypothetical protein